MIFSIYAFCAWVGVPWAPSAFEYEWYNFYENEEYSLTLEEGGPVYPSPYEPEGYRTEICRGGYYEEVVYQYIAANESGESELSPALTVQWVPNFDRDSNGVVGFGDFGAFAKAFMSTDPADSWADVDGNGSVGFPDFGKFVQRFGKCNNGTFEEPCG